ncbi:hypothetical protein HNY73_022835 [Argiope bruennichi]|uniref:Uncharacterized protein n=1 Tax=Argiope bruennichi TaxID=94029 RepID=A0A8T0E3F3_ARGBR|nr:hypothetical protein HNY73_022835 [Argiope bruennichi]
MVKPVYSRFFNGIFVRRTDFKEMNEMTTSHNIFKEGRSDRRKWFSSIDYRIRERLPSLLQFIPSGVALMENMEPENE